MHDNIWTGTYQALFRIRLDCLDDHCNDHALKNEGIPAKNNCSGECVLHSLAIISINGNLAVSLYTCHNI
jgi:hypothetical protein